MPIVKTLEGNVAVRYDHYSDFGSTTNPKFSLRWQPTREVLHARLVRDGLPRASLFDLVQPIYRTNTDQQLRRSVALRRSPARSSDCQLQFNSLRGGNTALKPERSTQYSVGGVWEPVAQAASIGVDYWLDRDQGRDPQVMADSDLLRTPAAFATSRQPRTCARLQRRHIRRKQAGRRSRVPQSAELDRVRRRAHRQRRQEWRGRDRPRPAVPHAGRSGPPRGDG